MNYSYRIYKNAALNAPLIGGSITASSYDDAVEKILERNKIHVIKTEYETSAPDFHYEYEGVKVGLIIYANAAISYENAKYKLRKAA